MFALEHPPSAPEGRRPSDYYPTPPGCVEALLEVHPPPPGRIDEPFSGTGAIVRPLIKAGYPVRATELRSECEAELAAAGAEVVIANTLEAYPGDADNVVSNVPYSIAEECCDAIFAPDPIYVALLFRLTYLGSAGRHAWWQRHRLSGLYTFSERLPCKGDGGGDSCNHAWCVWDKRRGDVQRIEVIARSPPA